MNAPGYGQAPSAVDDQPSFELTQGVSQLADHLHAQIFEFLRSPCPDKAERLSLDLERTRLYFLRIRVALIRESTPFGKGR